MAKKKLDADQCSSNSACHLTGYLYTPRGPLAFDGVFASLGVDLTDYLQKKSSCATGLKCFAADRQLRMHPTQQQS